MQLPGGWQSVPAQGQIPTTAQIQGALPQSTGVVAYPLQQFQLSPQVRK
jgi:nucleolysin TIA-1/TIAR